ncbi:MAG: flavodoxin family protein [Candidatus Bathyarchaeota archaeon]|nr:MAG: flavodoxin family protein [Candidatus Bathyarchaeota archaeon]
MIILGIVCSPRVKGNTEILIREVLESARQCGAEVRLISLSGKHISPCTHCEACYQTGVCSIDDDMSEIYHELIAADGIVLGTPVYFWSISAQAKLVIDRTYALRYPQQKLQSKIGGAVAVAGRRGQVEALTQLNTFFLGQKMLVVSLGVDGRGSKRGDILHDTRAMEQAKLMGQRMVDVFRETTTP